MADEQPTQPQTAPRQSRTPRQRQQPQRTRYRVSNRGMTISGDPAAGGGTVTLAAPSYDPPDVTGAPGAVFVLGASLAGVALWRSTLLPIVRSSWTGEKLQLDLPAPQVLGIVLFVGVIVFISDLSGDMAQLALWFIVALWAVYLIMNPSTVSGVLSLLSGQQSAGNTAPTSPNNPTGAPGGGGTGFA